MKVSRWIMIGSLCLAVLAAAGDEAYVLRVEPPFTNAAPSWLYCIGEK